MGAVAKSYMRKAFLICDFATAPFWISLYIRGKFCFLFISVGWKVGRETVSVRESDKVEVTLCKAPLKHENDKDDMPYTPPEFSRVKSFSFNFPTIRIAATVH